jgi:hypothetical protein
MSVPIDAVQAREELCDSLAACLVAGYPEKQFYVPRSYLEERITRATIKRCLPDAQDELLDFIWSRAPKLFAILLYSSYNNLESALQTFKDRHLTDKELPFPRETEQCTCMGKQARCKHKKARETLGKWSKRGWDHFYTFQWQFLALEFETGKFDYVLDEQIILPIQLRVGHGEGSFGEVREGELNEDHARGSERVSQAVGEILIAADSVIHSAANLVISRSNCSRVFMKTIPRVCPRAARGKRRRRTCAS